MMTVRLRTLARNMETKKEIRSRLKKQRSLLGTDECRNMSHEIYKRLMALEYDRDYDNILLYSAIRNEVNMDEYFVYLINKAKRIYYPRVSGDKMSFYRVRSLDELNCGSFNIKEPDMTREYTQADGRACRGLHFRIPVTESAMERAFMTDIYRLLQKETLSWQLELATISSYLAA